MFGKLFGKDKSPEEKLADDLNARTKKLWKEMKEGQARKEKTAEIYSVLMECYDTFEKTIIIENSRAYQLEKEGFSTADQRTRVREAAIGMLVAKEAMIRVQQINSESDLNSTLNRLGMALKQIRRLDNSAKSISGSTRKVLEKWYPFPLEDASVEGGYDTLTIPQEYKDRIDNKFVTNLMNGVSFENCIQYASLHSEEAKNSRKTQMERDLAVMDQVWGGSEEDPSVKKELDDKYGNPF